MNGDGAYPDYPSPNAAGDNSIVATTRFGIAGRTKLTHGLDAIMMGEWDMPSTTSGRTHNRYLYVGIDAYQYGSLTAGTGDGAFYTVAGATDIYHYLKTRANDYFVMGDQLPGQIMYSLSGLGWDLRISYQTANEYIEQFMEEILPQVKNYIEQDIDRILGKLNGYEAPRIGVLSSVLPVIDTKENLNNRIDWPFVKQLRKDYEVEYIRSDKTQIPVRIKTLLVVNPSSLAPMTIYALDQYLMRGGKIILFLDPFAESFMNLFGYINTAPSNLEQFLQNCGVLYQENRLIGDNQLSQNTLINQSDRYTVSGYPLWFDVTNQQIDA